MSEPDRDWLLAKWPNLRMANDLDLLTKVAAVIHAAQGLEELEQGLLDLISNLIPAQRVAVLLSEGGLAELTAIFGRDNSCQLRTTAEPSRTLIDRVLREGNPLLIENTNSGQAPAVPALTDSPVRSILAVPLVASQRVRGAIYLDTTRAAAAFNESHVQLMMALGSIAIVALEHAHRGESLKWGSQDNAEQTYLTSRPEGGCLNTVDLVSLVKHTLAGTSSPMRKIHQLIARVAPTDSTVLIRGESGTGKELAARAIHRGGHRAAGPFIAINCAALAETLLESEFFGYEKGAFTGADTQKKGKFELADGGTILLDEIGTMAPSLQAKLLRVLEERQFERVGGTRPIKIDVRVIAATNADLEEAVRRGTFRMDLYYRLKVISLTMPPLREHREDIALLVSRFAEEFGRRNGRRMRGVSPEALSLLLNYTWPGNVRELRNAIEHAGVLGTSRLIQPNDLPEALLGESRSINPRILNYKTASEEAKKQIIISAIIQAGGNHTRAAQVLGINPTYLSRLVRKMNLKGALSGSSEALFQ